MSTPSVNTSAAIPAGFGEAAFEAFLSTRDEPEWVTQSRRDAFKSYCELLESELDPEEFRRVDLRAMRPDRFQLNAASELSQDSADGNDTGTILKGQAEFAGHVTHIDGQLASNDLSAELAAKGVIFGDLAVVVRDHSDLIKKHFMTKAVDSETDRFSAWHAAFWTGGTVLYVPRNVSVEAPLHSLITLQAEKAADFSHTLIILEDGASATLLEETVSATTENLGLHVGAVELILGQEARLRYVQLQNWNQKAWHIAHQAGRVENNGFLQWTVGGIGAKLAHIHQDVVLDGRGAEAEVNGVTFSTEKQIHSFYTQQAHNAPETRSDLLYKQVLRDHSRAIWRGMILVEAEGQQTNGYQRNDSLMLSPTCRVDAIPGLEIEADDVRCTHGATAGRVDEEQIFYCMSRGMSEYEAMHMIVEGFFQTVFDRIPVEVVRETLNQAIIKKLGFGR
ncbi:MAG: Fe-S cluster assembly protein SufD [Planctomycetes bacterium]|nr:Fe-S cluster assembly protein SufD [Planctomycetota bacterium]MCH9728054.1 Fe-S cluster assembly protein SufD [Planctomycetota bacterium]MCH9775856.1 Fe-S cluster assembly protein SufD [Planctomycetota bacterium]MCH9792466.1 Fe-S cluster assembly protein SufD [Planctomycetota bacterium]